MNNKTKQLIDQVYYPEVIPDEMTAFVNNMQSAKAGKLRESEIRNIIIQTLEQQKLQDTPDDINVTSDYKLLLEFPKGRKYNVIRKLSSVLVEHKKVDNYLLVKCLSGNSKLTKSRYYQNINNASSKNKSTNYHVRIQNSFKTINKYWKQLGHKAKFDSKTSEIVTF